MSRNPVAVKHWPQLRMRRADLDALPEAVLPAGYVLRTSRLCDAPGIGRVLAEAFQEEWDEERVRRDLLEHLDVPKTFHIERDGIVVATASYQTQAAFSQVGWVHWVGALPEHAGKGLGKSVTLAVLQTATEHGKLGAMLTTDDFRLAAIKTYLAVGFSPDMCDPTHPARWATVFAELGV